MSRPRNIKWGSRAWNHRLIQLAFSRLDISQCQKCGSPVHKGYCCEFCGDRNPSKTFEQEAREEAFHKATQFVHSLSGFADCIVCGRKTNATVKGNPRKPVCINHFDNWEEHHVAMCQS